MREFSEGLGHFPTSNFQPIRRRREGENTEKGTLFLLNDMVKAVYVHAPDKSKGYREQQIDISYDLVGILPAALLNDLQNGETA